ncbi:tRNA (5-methylaminomethyl-2-thiouridine)(34)-methyltransferase MnmD [Reichenbachiella sp. MALMAid0571]|uniref:tRNA (5-methylaminomethyl-2-thiouridine)(34)-methyltransferase MnmD n=1 Tax=Reichenbachiella sp. MALMAid0571 TaxID=3143939 RepID=UPI0032E00527
MLEIIKTKDGSHSLLIPEMNETYHSTHGALTESNYVFIDKGLKYYVEKEATTPNNHINILEVGFGTGLNALLTSIYANTHKQLVSYFSLETNPIDPLILEQLNYHKLIDDTKGQELFQSIHACEWEKLVEINKYFSIKKINQALQEYSGETELFDLVYFDAFAPSRQPEMWDITLFEKIYGLMKKGGVLVTYCAQGQFKRDLKACGFEVEKIPGPPGKAEMTRACK